MKKFRILLIVIVIAITSSCDRRRSTYVPKYLKPQQPVSANYKSTQQDITLMTSQLSPKECRQQFGHYAKQLFDDENNQRINVIRLAVCNNSTHTYVLDIANIEIPIIEKKELISLMRKDDTEKDSTFSFDIKRKILPHTCILLPEDSIDDLIFVHDTNMKDQFFIKLDRTDCCKQLSFLVSN